MNPNSHHVSDVRVLRTNLGGTQQWVPAPPDWAAAYQHYKAKPTYSQEAPFNYDNRFLVYREENNCYMPTRIQCSDTGDVHAIMDCADVKVFLQDAEPVNWYPARSVYYERNDAHGTRVRICDHEGARAGFRGFYTRITMDPGVIVTPPPAQPQQPLPSYTASSAVPLQLPPLISAVKTNVEEEQCIMCYENAKNLTFGPCAHNIACSECYVKLIKPRECPVCKQAIESLS